MGHRSRRLAFAGAALAAFPAMAAEFNYELGTGFGHSDNIRRTPVAPQSEDIAAATLKFSLDQNSRRVRADMVGDLAWNEYLNDTFESELIGNFVGGATFGFVPERFEWFVGDSFGQVLSDPFIPATPENSENINQFATGPNFIAALGSQTRLQFNARYINTDYEIQPFDSESYRGEIALIRLLSDRSAVSFNLNSQDVKVKEAALQADYKNSEVFLRYDVNGARTNVRADVGAGQLDREALAETEDGLVLRAEVSRRLSASSTAQLSMGREFDNAASAFTGDLVNSGVDISTAPGRQSALPFTHDYFNLRWRFDRNRTGMALYGNWSERTYDDQPTLDQTMLTWGAEFRRELSAATSLQFDGNVTRAEFDQPGSNYDELNAGLTFNWQMSRRLTLAFTYDYLDRDSDLSAASFDESRLWLSLGFGSGRPRSTFAPPTFGADTAP